MSDKTWMCCIHKEPEQCMNPVLPGTPHCGEHTQPVVEKGAPSDDVGSEG